MVERYYRELVRFLSHRVSDSDTASDIAQESYVRVLALHAAGTTIIDLRGLLYRTARNLVVDTFRRTHLRSQYHGEPHHDETAAHASTQPEHAYESSQQTKMLIAAIESLPPRCREAFILHRFDGLTHAEISERMGISRNMVEKHIIRGVLTCRRALAAWHGEDFSRRAATD